MKLTLLVLLCLCVATTAIAADDAYKVIVHPDNPATTVDRDFLREAFLKKTVEWGNGTTIRPIDLSGRYAAHDRFAQEILKKTPSQLKSYWNQQIFSGKGTPPPEADSPADVIKYVVENPGAIGYLPASVDPGRAKVVKVN